MSSLVLSDPYNTSMRRKPEYYLLGESESSITASRLRRANREVQRKAMEIWFHQRFESPDTLPYDSSEGGYQWIWGGPYDAREELEAEFGGIVPDKRIAELADDVEEISLEWSANSNRFVPDDYEYEFAPGEFTIHDTFHMHLHNIELLLALKTPDKESRTYLRRLCFANVITAFETYLSGTFAAALKTDRELLERFVETNPDFKQEKISLGELFKQLRDIEKRVAVYLSGIVWHNLAKVMPMYKTTLAVDFHGDLDSVHRAIRDRHDIVHRNGKSPDGKEGSWDEKAIRELIKVVTELVNDIEGQVNNPMTPATSQEISI
jgi:hypothetical protein